MILTSNLTSKLLPLAYQCADLIVFPLCLAEDDGGRDCQHGEKARSEHGGFGR
jgi:hypothetical protein